MFVPRRRACYRYPSGDAVSASFEIPNPSASRLTRQYPVTVALQAEPEGLVRTIPLDLPVPTGTCAPICPYASTVETDCLARHRRYLHRLDGDDDCAGRPRSRLLKVAYTVLPPVNYSPIP